MENIYKNKDWPTYNRDNEEYTDVTSWSALKYFTIRDFERINRRISFGRLMKALMFEPGYKYVFWLRITRFYFLKSRLYLPLFILSRLFLKHYAYKYSFDISYRAKILPGFAIGHWGYIIIQADSEIGSNCFVRPGVVLGRKSVYNSGKQTIGDNVEFGAGAKCIENVAIGNNVTVGANSVVTHDVPSNCVVAGAPAKIIKRL